MIVANLANWRCYVYFDLKNGEVENGKKKIKEKFNQDNKRSGY